MIDAKNDESGEKIKKREIRKINTVRRNREINRKLIDHLIGKKHCTLLTNKFDCNEFRSHKLHKGKEAWCHSPDYVNCPAFNHYVNHEMIQNLRKITGIEDEKNSD